MLQRRKWKKSIFGFAIVSIIFVNEARFRKFLKSNKWYAFQSNPLVVHCTWIRTRYSFIYSIPLILLVKLLLKLFSKLLVKWILKCILLLFINLLKNSNWVCQYEQIKIDFCLWIAYFSFINSLSDAFSSKVDAENEFLAFENHVYTIR